MYIIHFFKPKALFLFLSLCLLSGCGRAGESTAALAFQAFPNPSSLELSKEPEEEAVFQEDTNQYGNTTGNQYNNGVFLADPSQNAFYFFNTYENALCKTDIETGATMVLADGLLGQMQFQEGMLYGTLLDIEEDTSKFISLNPADGRQSILRESPPQYLQMVNGVFYFTDAEENNLRKLPADGGEEEILLDERVYYPVVYKDWLFFQRDSDGESLYRMPKDGGEPEKLNDVHTYDILVSRDRIYYKALEDTSYSLRSIGLDGSDEQILLETNFWRTNLYKNCLYFVEEGNEAVISYLNLDEESYNVQTLDLSEPIRQALKSAYNESIELSVDSYDAINFSGDYILFMVSFTVNGSSFRDEYLYGLNTETILVIPEFCRIEQAPEISQAPEAEATPEQQAPTISDATSKEAQARAVAQSIADSIPPGSDLERVQAAAQIVAGYCSRAVYTTEDPDYCTAYGVFCKGVYTCAGSTRALGMVLECMGFRWGHVNPNMWTHQWCEVTMDGQLGYADGMGGVAGYGEYPY